MRNLIRVLTVYSGLYVRILRMTRNEFVKRYGPDYMLVQNANIEMRHTSYKINPMFSKF